MPIYKPRIHMHPVICKNRSCSERKVLKHLPFKNKRLLKDVSTECPKCKNNVSPLSLICLLKPDENGEIDGAKLVSNLGQMMFEKHPIKRWTFYCDRAKQNYHEGNESNPDYPKLYTTNPDAATCYDCLENLVKSIESGENQDEKLLNYFKTKE